MGGGPGFCMRKNPAPPLGGGGPGFCMRKNPAPPSPAAMQESSSFRGTQQKGARHVFPAKHRVFSCIKRIFGAETVYNTFCSGSESRRAISLSWYPAPRTFYKLSYGVLRANPRGVFCARNQGIRVWPRKRWVPAGVPERGEGGGGVPCTPLSLRLSRRRMVSHHNEFLLAGSKR